MLSKSFSNFSIHYQLLSEITNVSGLTNGNLLYFVSLEQNDISSSYIFSSAIIEQLIKEPDNLTNILESYKKLNDTYVVRKEFSSLFSQYNLHEYRNEMSKQNKKDEASLLTKTYIPTLARLQSEEFEIIQFLPKKIYLNVIKNAKGQLFSEPIYLDYIYAHLDNQHYDLDQLAEHLSNMNQISFVIPEQYTTLLLPCPLKGDEVGINKIIQNIDGCNATSDRDECLSIIFYPNHEQIQKMIDWQLDRRVKDVYNVHHYITKDILNLRPFLLKPVVTEELVRKFKH